MAGQCGTAGHVTIGDKVSLAGRSGVTTNLPGGEVYSGLPAQPFREEMKLRATVRRLPKLVERVKALEAALKIRDLAGRLISPARPVKMLARRRFRAYCHAHGS